MIKVLLYFCVTFILFSCNEKNIEQTEKQTIQKKDIKTINKLEPKTEIDFIGLPDSLKIRIFNECDNLDATFYYGDKSVNMAGENVKYVLSMIYEPAPEALNNNIIGHLMLSSQGNQLSFVEISMNDNNNYVIFNINKSKFYNKINKEGVEFFNKMRAVTPVQ